MVNFRYQCSLQSKVPKMQITILYPVLKGYPVYTWICLLHINPFMSSIFNFYICYIPLHKYQHKITLLFCIHCIVPLHTYQHNRTLLFCVQCIITLQTYQHKETLLFCVDYIIPLHTYQQKRTLLMCYICHIPLHTYQHKGTLLMFVLFLKVNIEHFDTLK